MFLPEGCQVRQRGAAWCESSIAWLLILCLQQRARDFSTAALFSRRRADKVLERQPNIPSLCCRQPTHDGLVVFLCMENQSFNNPPLWLHPPSHPPPSHRRAFCCQWFDTPTVYLVDLYLLLCSMLTNPQPAVSFL